MSSKYICAYPSNHEIKISILIYNISSISTIVLDFNKTINLINKNSEFDNLILYDTNKNFTKYYVHIKIE